MANETLSNEIVRLSLLLAVKAKNADTEVLTKILYLQSILNQAQTVSTEQPKQARKLYNRVRSLMKGI